MIEPLEPRTFFSLTPHAALVALRADVASIGSRIKVMIAANKSAIANLHRDLSIFPTASSTDNAALRELNYQFASQVSVLANDFNDIKVLFGQDIKELINRCNAFNRHPTGGVGDIVQQTQQQLASQGAAAVSQLSQDGGQLQAAYLPALALVSAPHPDDATLVTRSSHISTVLSTNIGALDSVASTVAGIDIPDFINALEPNGISTINNAA
jgi:hypothetical protein